MKVSYSCITNVQQLIKKQNNLIQNKKNKTTLSCNCCDKNGCPLNGNCRTDNIIYKANLKKSCLFPIRRPGEIKNSHEPPGGRFFLLQSLCLKRYTTKRFKKISSWYSKNVTLHILYSIFMFNFYVDSS